MELFKDLLKMLIEGIAEFWAENRISDNRKEYLSGKKTKRRAAFCFWGSVLLAAVLLVGGILGILKGKLAGALLLFGGMGLGVYMLAEWGSLKK